MSGGDEAEGMEGEGAGFEPSKAAKEAQRRKPKQAKVASDAREGTRA
jgi:hypothetical protein